MRLVALLAVALPVVDAFVVRPSPSTTAITQLLAVPYEFVSGIGYQVAVEKPLGVVFGENGEPFGGLRVDDLDPEANGAKAGLKVGDQLLAVNEQSVVGDSFEIAMDSLRDAPSQLSLDLYRGNVQMLYTTLSNQPGFNEQLEAESEEVVMDESYESPVVVAIDDDEEPLTAGDFFKGLQKIGSSAFKGGEGEKKGGFFGGMFSGETIQLEGDDATGTGLS